MTKKGKKGGKTKPKDPQAVVNNNPKGRQIKGKGGFFVDAGTALGAQLGAMAAGTIDPALGLEGAYLGGKFGGKAAKFIGDKVTAFGKNVWRQASRKMGGRGTFASLPVNLDEVPTAKMVKANGLVKGGKIPSNPVFLGNESTDKRMVFVSFKIRDIYAPSSTGRENAIYYKHTIQPAAATSFGSRSAMFAQSKDYMPMGAGYLYYATKKLGTLTDVGVMRAMTTTNVAVAINDFYDFDIAAADPSTNAVTHDTVESYAYMVECDPAEVEGVRSETQSLKLRTGAISGDYNEYDLGQVVIEVTAGTDTVGAKVGELYFVGGFLVDGIGGNPHVNGYLRATVSSTSTSAMYNNAAIVSQLGVCNAVTVTSTGIVFDATLAGCVFEIVLYLSGSSATQSYNNPVTTGLSVLSVVKLTTGNAVVDYPTNALTTGIHRQEHRVRVLPSGGTFLHSATTVPGSNNGHLTLMCLGVGLLDSDL